MSKEKVFVVLSHKNSLRKGSKTEWEVSETVEFVNQLRKKHLTTSSAIGDYLNRQMITGSRFGLSEYNKFEEYLRTKYDKQLSELDSMYGKNQIEAKIDNSAEIFSDEFGNIRSKTVFDQVA